MDYRSTRNRKGQTGLTYTDSEQWKYENKPAVNRKNHEKYNYFTCLLLIQVVAVASILCVFTGIRLVNTDVHQNISAGLSSETIAGVDIGQAAQEVIDYVRTSETFTQLFPAENMSQQGDSARWTSVFLMEQSSDILQNERGVCPIDYTKITSYFGERNDPFSRKPSYHTGWDMAAPVGSNVYAAWDGTVQICTYDDVGGYYIVIEHAHHTSTYYGHLSQISVEVGQSVYAGDRIGLSGNTGKTTGPHLHFEVAHNGIPVDPARYLNA